MAFFFVFNIDKDIVKVYNNKNIKLFCQNLIDISFKYGWYINQSQRHYLVSKIAITGSKSSFLFIIFLDLYLMISIDKVKLDKTLSLAKSAQKLSNQR